MTKAALLQKLASPQMPTFSRWALPKEEKFPLDNEALVKCAAVAFDEERLEMTPAQRLVAARHIAEAASEHGVSLLKSAALKYAASRLSPYWHQALSLRKEATCHLADRELDQLSEVALRLDATEDLGARVQGLDKVAGALEDFDRRNNITGLWDNWLPDPAFSVYGPTVSPADELLLGVKVAGFDVDATMLASADYSLLDGIIEPEIASGLSGADDKLAVFASLPEPHKELVFQTLFHG